jgi:hypothetical protein
MHTLAFAHSAPARSDGAALARRAGRTAVASANSDTGNGIAVTLRRTP